MKFYSDTGLIYRIRCSVNDRSYVGYTSKLGKYSADYLLAADSTSLVYEVLRFRSHFQALTRGVHPCSMMQADWVLHGALAFSFEILEVGRHVRGFGGAASPDSLEFSWMVKLRSIYNREYRDYVLKTLLDRYGIFTLDQFLHGEISSLLVASGET